MKVVEGITQAELIRRSINFYQVKIEAIKNNKKLFFESEDGMKERIMI